MSDAKRFEDWIIFDAHEFQYPNGDSMSEDAGAFLLDLNDLRADATLWRDHVGQRQAVHDTWTIMEDEAKTFFGDVAALRGKWAAIPWDAIKWCAVAVESDSPVFLDDARIVKAWHNINAPEERTK